MNMQISYLGTWMCAVHSIAIDWIKFEKWQLSAGRCGSTHFRRFGTGSPKLGSRQWESSESGPNSLATSNLLRSRSLHFKNNFTINSCHFYYICYKLATLLNLLQLLHLLHLLQLLYLLQTCYFATITTFAANHLLQLLKITTFAKNLILCYIS